MEEVKVVLQRKEYTALIAWQSSNGDVEFVTTYSYREDGTWGSGRYFGNDLQAALNDYKERVKGAV